MECVPVGGQAQEMCFVYKMVCRVVVERNEVLPFGDQRAEPVTS